MSLGSKVIVKLFHVSYFSGGRLRGVQDGLRRARSADSEAALKNGSDIRAASTIWASRTVRSGFMRTRNATSSEAPSLATESGRASGGERVCKYETTWVVAVTIKKK